MSRARRQNRADARRCITVVLFLRRLHAAAGGRRGPQTFSAPADCSRRPEWKLGKGWKTGTWHPRGGGGGGRERRRAGERESGRAGARRRRPGRLSRERRPLPRRTRARPGSAPRAPEKCHPGGCARGWPGCAWGPGLLAGGGARKGALPRPGALARPRDPARRLCRRVWSPPSLALTQGRALPPAFLKLENTSPPPRRPGRSRAPSLP